MKTLAALTLLALVAACASTPRTGLGRDADGRERQLSAQPSDVVAAELGFARLARDRGQWTAFRETMLDDAEMFAPKRILARDFLKGRADPPQSVVWQPDFVAISCDGRSAISTGPTLWPDGRRGYFSTVWQRQRDGDWKWSLDHGDFLATPRPDPDSVRTRIATCGTKPGIPIAAPATGEDLKVGVSPDQTLIWRSSVLPDGSRRISADLWTGTRFETVLDDRVAAPSG